MNSFSDLLVSIGLTDKEATSYLTLLRYGTRPTSFIAKKASLNRGTTYIALHSLLDKGLVVKSTKGKVQHFTALSPRHLLNFARSREEKFANAKASLKASIDELATIANPLTTKPRIEFFEGIEGARTAFEDTLRSKDRVLRAFLSLTGIIDFLGEKYFYDYTTRRIKKSYTLHAIRTLEQDKLAISRSASAKRYLTNRKERREVRYISEDLAFPMTIYLYDNKLNVISSKEENFALIIESKEFADMQRKLFGLLWDSVATRRKA